MAAKHEILRLLGEIERAAGSLAEDALELREVAEGLDEECDTHDSSHMSRLARSIDRYDLSSLVRLVEELVEERDEEEEDMTDCGECGHPFPRKDGRMDAAGAIFCTSCFAEWEEEEWEEV